jgi:hypothetical protein
MQPWFIGAALGTVMSGVVVGVGHLAGLFAFAPVVYEQAVSNAEKVIEEAADVVPAEIAWPLPLDVGSYDRLLLGLVDMPTPEAVAEAATATTTATSTSASPQYEFVFSSTTNVTIAGEDWPAAAPYPHGDAILPFERIIAYYGNFYSTRMGILGELPRAEVLAQLASTSAAWEAADPDTPVRPAIHYIAMVAQADAGSDGMYRNVMPDEHIERAFSMAEEIDGIVFLDLQVGLSSLPRELPQFREYFSRPETHLAVDPEFSMKRGNPPGTVIGTFDAADINFAIDWLAEIVREYQLPPKILVVHRFTQNMVTNYQDIRPRPEVQVVMHMDGWGPRTLKRDTYRTVIEPEPVQFAGLKIFYKNDLKPPSTGIFSPVEALELHPEPIYIQYQ